MQENIILKVRLGNDLRNAIENQELRLVYQPIFDLVTGKPIKAEALIRWKHPKLGEISPTIFIPIAEQLGLIHKIGNWVFETTIHQIKHITEKFDQSFQIGINKSPVQFRGFSKNHEEWLKRMQAVGIKGKNLCIEITEGTLMSASEDVLSTLNEFRNNGIQLAIDDFGTGYSAMAYLKKYKIDYIKIDQEFVRNLKHDSEDFVLCEAIIAMGHKLKLKIIAEGIEGLDQVSILKEADADYGQGYYFSKPLEAKEFENFLSSFYF